MITIQAQRDALAAVVRAMWANINDPSPICSAAQAFEGAVIDAGLLDMKKFPKWKLTPLGREALADG